METDAMEIADAEVLTLEERILAKMRDVPNFPKPGILFKDITPVLADPAMMHEIIDRFADFALGQRAEVILGVESRGFVIGMPVALKLNLPFVPIRKAGKLPWKTAREDYELEYGTASMEVHIDAIASGQRCIIIDDLIATGGTAAASGKLVKKLDGELVGYAFLIELGFLDGRGELGDTSVLSLVTLK